MASLARPLVMAALAMSLAGSLVVIAPLTAMADTVTPLFPGASNAADYALTVRGMDIYAAQSDAARAAWTPQLAAVAARDANIYRAAQVYGQLDPEELAQVIPMNKAVDASLNGKLTRGMVVSNGATTWKGTGFRFPAFASGRWAAVRNVAGGVAAAAAMYAFDQRADIANGVASWVGVDATGAVCSDPVAGGHNPINWITGQNCDQWKAGIAFEANKGVVAGVSWGPACSIAVPTDCATFVGAGADPYAGVQVLCFHSDSPWTAGSGTFRLYFTGTQNGAAWEGSVRGGYRNGGFDAMAPYCPAGSNQAFLPGADGYAVTTYRVDEAGTQPVAATTASSDPERVIRCSQYGQSGNVSNGYTAKFRQSQVVGGSSPEPVCVPLASGDPVVRVVVTQIDPDGETVLQDKSETPAATDYRNNYAAQCGTAANQHSCLLDVLQVSNGISCYSATATCTDWYHDPSRDTKYQCQYGGKNETVQQCAVLANTFDAAKRAAGNPYADPLTGDDLHAKTGSDLDTQTMGNPVGAVIQPNGEVASCWGGGDYGAFNPVGWIVRGGQCILNWAFVPRPAVVVAQTQGVKARFDASTPGKLAVALSTFQFVSPGTGCSGVPIPVPIPDARGHMAFVTRYMLAACAGDFFAPYAPPFSAFIGGSSCVAGFFGCRRILSSVFGYGAAS